MSQADEILEYIYLRHITGPEFLSQISTCQSQSDIQSVLRYSVKDAIGGYGYRTELWYDKVMRAHLGSLAGWYKWTNTRNKEEKSAYQRVFNVDDDPYFGETLKFDDVAFVEYVDAVVSRSKVYAKVADQVRRFGISGLRKAIGRLAGDHGWARVADDSSFEASTSSLSLESNLATQATLTQQNYLLSPTEGDRVVSEIRSLKGVIERANLPQSDKTQALMLVDATLILSQLPIPNWKAVKELLYVIAAISTVLAVALQIAEMIK